MTHRLKAIGLALFAAFAMSAMAAAGASANTVEATADTEKVKEVTVTGTSTTESLTAGESSISCSHTTYEGTTDNPSKTLTVVPSWSGCKAFGFATTHIENTGCAYAFELTNEHHNEETEFTAGVELECEDPEEDHIVVTPTFFGSSVCTITFGAQDVNGDVSVTNAGTNEEEEGTHDLEVHGTLSEIHYEVTEGGFGCPSEGTHEDGVYHADTTLRAYDDEAHEDQVGITVETVGTG